MTLLLIFLLVLGVSHAFVSWSQRPSFSCSRSARQYHTSSTSSSLQQQIFMSSSSPSSYSSSATSLKSQAHADFIKKSASIDVPKRLDTLLSLLELKGETIMAPTDRKGLNPFLIPLSKNETTGSVLAYIRWPTQKVDMDLQLVRTTQTGIRLVAMGSTSFCRRMVAEMDFYSSPNSDKAIELVNREGQLYERGEFLGLLRSGKFPAITNEDLALILDRYSP